MNVPLHYKVILRVAAIRQLLGELDDGQGPKSVVPFASHGIAAIFINTSIHCAASSSILPRRGGGSRGGGGTGSLDDVDALPLGAARRFHYPCTGTPCHCLEEILPLTRQSV